MADKPLEDLLRSDHATLARRLDSRSPTDRLVRRMKRRAHRKTAILSAVTATGFVIACAQFPALNALAENGVLVVAAAAVTALVLAIVAFTLPDLD